MSRSAGARAGRSCLLRGCRPKLPNATVKPPPKVVKQPVRSASHPRTDPYGPPHRYVIAAPDIAMQAVSATSELTSSQRKAISSLTTLLHSPLRITVLDNRTFIGTFTCIDPQCNIILSHAEEFLPDPTTKEEEELRENREMYWPKSQRAQGEGEGWGGRQVGMILIPGNVVVKVEVEEGWDKKGEEVL